MGSPPEGNRPPGSRWEPVALDSITAPHEKTPLPPPAPYDSGIGRIFGGKYLVLDRLGSGGMAVVYRAQEQGMLRREVAIKVLTPESALSQATIARFLKEAQAISNIGHPNVVQVIELGRTDEGQIYLVMERLVGKTLYDILKEMGARGETFTWERLASLVIPVCRALQAAHKQGIIHRDIKPSNVFCGDLDDEQWHIKVLDFGIAKVQRGASAESAETPLTKEGMFLGTPHYAAPESIQRRNEDAIDGRADIFAVGVMMYQCLTGSLPFQGPDGYADPVTIMYRTVHESPQSLRARAPNRNIPLEVEAIVLKAMHRDPEQRYRTVAELIEAIRGLLRKSGVVFDQGATVLASAPPASQPRPLASESDPQPAPTPHESPTLAPGPSHRSAVIAFSILVTMLCGVIILALLVLRDVRTPRAKPPDPKPERTVSASPVQPKPSSRRPTQPKPEAPPSEPPTPTKSVEAPVPTPADVPESPKPTPAAGPTNIPESPKPTPAVEPPKTSKTETTARKRAITARLDELAREKSITKCLPLTTEFGDGVSEDLPIMLVVDAEGRAQVSVTAEKVAPRVPSSAEACILAILRAAQYPAGQGSLKVPHTLRFD